MTAKQIRRLRARAGLTQKALGELLGVHQVTVARWETGERHIPEPSARLMRIICARAQGPVKGRVRAGRPRQVQSAE